MFFKFTMPNQKFDENNSIRIIFMKIIIKVNIIKIYKNAHFITRKFRITSIFISFSIILFVTKQLGIGFSATRESSKVSFYILWNVYLSGQYTIKEGYKKTKSHTSWVLYWWGIPANTKKHLWTALLHFLSLMAFRNIFYYRRMSTDRFITHFVNLTTFRNKS